MSRSGQPVLKTERNETAETTEIKRNQRKLQLKVKPNRLYPRWLLQPLSQQVIGVQEDFQGTAVLYSG